MQATSWIDKIADESNLWLTAVKAEDGAEYERAALLYLRDASECLSSGMQLKAALSCYCAANCMEKMGARARARQLYAESAQIYLEKAQTVAGVSVREFVWCLRESYKAFKHANKREKAEEVRRYYASLAGRIDPFIFTDGLHSTESIQSEETTEDVIQEHPAITQEIERFLQPRKDGYRRMGASPNPRKKGTTTSNNPKRRPQDNEASIINQLG